MRELRFVSRELGVAEEVVVFSQSVGCIRTGSWPAYVKTSRVPARCRSRWPYYADPAPITSLAAQLFTVHGDPWEWAEGCPAATLSESEASLDSKRRYARDEYVLGSQRTSSCDATLTPLTQHPPPPSHLPSFSFSSQKSHVAS